MTDLREKLQPLFQPGAVDKFFPLVAVDVGNNRVKCGLYHWEEFVHGLPCRQEISLANVPAELSRLEEWLRGAQIRGGWWIATVNRPTSTELIDWLRTHRPDESIVLLTASDLPLPVNLPRPDMVGIDRLVDALAAYSLHEGDGAVVVVDIGSAITVDFVSDGGVFEGGAILPGIGLAARALYEFTDMLPLVDISDLTAPPPPVGKNTVEAMKAGIFWGALGAIGELAGRMLPADSTTNTVILTGGGSKIFAQLLGKAAPEANSAALWWTFDHWGKMTTVRYIPHLTLWGIGLAAAWVMYTGQFVPTAGSAQTDCLSCGGA